MHSNHKIVFKILGLLTMSQGIGLMACSVFGFIYSEIKPAASLITTGSICFVLGSLLFKLLRHNKIRLSARKGYLIAFISWVYCSFIGAVAFFFSGQDYTLIGSFFESVAGFTTTGATVFNFEAMPKCLLLWRALSSWMGGMGIIVLVVSIFPALGISSQSIVPSETIESIPDKVGAKFSNTGKSLYIAYFSMTALELLLLWIGPLDFFSALINTLTSISTGGLFVASGNLAVFSNLYVRFVILAFTVVSSINYYMLYLFLRGKRQLALSNFEIKTFFKIIGVSSVIVAASLWLSGTYDSLWQAFKDGLCQVVSFASTSGYYVCDYTKWPTTCIVVLISLLFIGGCTMSTSGGLKVTRVAIFIKIIRRGIFLQIHPNAVKAVVVDKKAIEAKKVSSATMHIFLFFILTLLSCIIVAMDNLDLETTISAVVSLLSNTGAALGEIGPNSNYGIFSQPIQLFMSLLMIAGRLELYAVILFFTRTFWTTDRVKAI